jgi:hypothetical protein
MTRLTFDAHFFFESHFFFPHGLHIMSSIFSASLLLCTRDFSLTSLTRLLHNLKAHSRAQHAISDSRINAKVFDAELFNYSNEYITIHMIYINSALAAFKTRETKKKKRRMKEVRFERGERNDELRCIMRF